MNSSPQILLSGYYGFHNLGDEAILTAVIASLRQEMPDCRITVLSANPTATRETHGVNAIPRMDFKAIHHALRDADLLLSGGGSLFQDATSVRSLLYYLGVVWLALRMKKPVMVYAQGIGPLTRRSSRALTRLVLNRVNLITLRDEESAHELAQLGVTRPRIGVTADPTFTLQPASSERADEILAKAGATSPCIGIALRQWRGWFEAEENVERMARTLESIGQWVNGSMVLLPLQFPQDADLAQKMTRHMNRRGGRPCQPVVVNEPLRPDEMLAIIGKMDVLIAMRLHALIFAAAMNVPMVGIVYDPKVERLLRQVGGAACGFDDSKWTEIARQVWEQRERIRTKLEENVRLLRERAKENARLAAALVRERQHVALEHRHVSAKRGDVS
jgi:polysaccharide pyruvyl transferase CsaB